VLWQDIHIGGTGSWVPPIRPRASAGGRRPSPADANGFTSSAVSAGDTATQMAARAALTALRDSGVPGSELSLLAHAAFQDEDHYTPSPYLLRVLGSQAPGIEIGAASDGGAAALVAAAEHLTARPDARAAMVTAGSRFPQERWGYVHEIGYLAGDAGAAAVLTRRPGVARLVATAHTAAPQLEALSRAWHSVSAERDEHRLFIADTGLTPYVDALQSATRACIETVLEEASLTPADIAHTAVIAIGAAVLDVVLSGPPLNTRAERTSWTFGRHIAHAGPCDLLLAVDRLLRTGSLSPGQRVLLVSFGLGFRWTTAILEITTPEVRP
jgi:3-oxoacyl-[acyl-carrier-protein] synthase-3